MDNWRNKSRRQAQPENAASKYGPRQDTLAEGAQEHLPSPGRVQQDLRQALQHSKAENNRLLSENASLRKFIADMELRWGQEKRKMLIENEELLSDNATLGEFIEDKKLRWEEEKKRMLTENQHQLLKSNALRRQLADMDQEKKRMLTENQHLLLKNNAMRMQVAEVEQEKKRLLEEKDYLASTLLMRENNMNSLEMMLESTRASQTQAENESSQVAEKMKAQQEETHSLKESLRIQKTQTESMAEDWRAERDHVSKMEEEAAEQQKNMEKRVTQITLERDDLVTTVREKEIALAESLAKISQQKINMQLNEQEWHKKYIDLKNLLSLEQSEKKANHEKIKALQAATKKLKELRHKEREMEQEMKLHIPKNAQLQEHNLNTESESERQMKTQKKKAKNKTEKRELKEKLKREKKEKRREE